MIWLGWAGCRVQAQNFVNSGANTDDGRITTDRGAFFHQNADRPYEVITIIAQEAVGEC